jgi:hypothetical protein
VRSPRGTDAPSSRRRSRASRAAGAAPSRSNVASAASSGSGSSASASARAASYGHPRDRHASAAARASPAEPESVRLRDPLGRLVERVGLLLPVRELAREPQVALLERERIRGPSLLERPPGVAREPRRLGAGGVDVAEAFEVAARPRERERGALVPPAPVDVHGREPRAGVERVEVVLVGERDVAGPRPACRARRPRLAPTRARRGTVSRSTPGADAR